ncbi:MAG: hypothetical protein KGK11_07785 [Sphingomonadales bacterium]|nr:hypothetical protein [Sphingomonadales bacterium]
MPPDPPRPTLAALRKLARTHGEAALKVLAEVAEAGSSEASRVTAALALLERGYGKPVGAAPGEATARPALPYNRIELVDGGSSEASGDERAPDDQG